MANKPTELPPEWATDGSADVVTPNAGKKVLGWIGGERPPGQVVNWFWNLAYQWLLWVSDLIFGPDSASQTAPVTQWTDADGRVRSFVDANGLRGGLCPSQWFDWGPLDSTSFAGPTTGGVIVPGANNAAKVGCDVDTNCDVNIESGSAIPRAPFIKTVLATGTTTDEQVSVYTGQGAVSNAIVLDADVTCVLEFPAALRTVGASQGFNAYMGLAFHFHLTNGNDDFNDAAGLDTYVNFRYEDADTTWIAAVSDGGGSESSVDTMVSPTADVYQIFRIEFHGSNTPRGVANSNAPVALFFIDGAKVAEITSNVPEGNTENVAWGWRLDTDGITPGAARRLCVGPTYWAYNYYLDVVGSDGGYTLSG